MERGEKRSSHGDAGLRWEKLGAFKILIWGVETKFNRK